jgi:hypothetical protein
MKIILLKALKAFGKFLRYAYASQITIGVFGLVEYLAGYKLIGALIIAWGVLLTINEFKSYGSKL